VTKCTELEQKWIEYITQLNIDFHREAMLYTWEHSTEEWENTLVRFDVVIANYNEAFKKIKHFKEISNASAKNFLYLVPTISKYDPCISIDADTGYFNITFKSKDSGILTALITEDGVIHYSISTHETEDYGYDLGINRAVSWDEIINAIGYVQGDNKW